MKMTNEEMMNLEARVKMYKEIEATKQMIEETKEQVAIQQRIDEVMTLADRTKNLIKMAELCVENDVPIFKITSGCQLDGFTADRFSHNIGFANRRTHRCRPSIKDEVFIPMLCVYANGENDLFDGEGIFFDGDNIILDCSGSYTSIMFYFDRFIQGFDDFEKRFYEFVDKECSF